VVLLTNSNSYKVRYKAEFTGNALVYPRVHSLGDEWFNTELPETGAWEKYTGTEWRTT